MIGPTASPQTVRVNNIDIGYGVDPSKPVDSSRRRISRSCTAATTTGAADVYVTDAAAIIAAASQRRPSASAT